MRDKHVIILMADQLRYDALGNYTPNINQLMDESVVFNRSYCASPLCVPARGAFFTGKYPNVTGSLINPWFEQEKAHGIVGESHQNLYHLLDQSWDSWHTGKQHLYMDPKPERRGDTRTHWLTLEGRYEAYLKQNGKRRPGGPAFKGRVPEMAFGNTTRVKSYSIPTTGHYDEGLDYFFDGFILKDSLDAIRNRDTSKPFLLNAMFLAPHPPLEIPEPWFSKVKKPQVPSNVGVWYENQSPLQMYNLTGFIGQQYDRADWERIWEVYLGLVSLLDHCVGEIVQELKKHGMYDDSLILFTSDHGEMLGSHGLWQKMCMYEESVRTPLAFKFPKGFDPVVTSSDHLVSSVDVLPTLCDYLEVPMPNGVSGVSLMPLVRGEEVERDTIFIQFDGNGARSNFQRSVVSGHYKLIADIFKDEIFLELYDVVSDPQETENLIFDEENYGEIIVERIDQLSLHMKKTNDLLELPANLYTQFLNKYKKLKK